MRGSLIHRGTNCWALVLDRGYILDPATGRRRRKQQWISFRGTQKEAGAKLAELVRAANRHEFVEPTKITVGDWLTRWLTTVVTPTKRLRTTRTYRAVITGSLIPALGEIRLQALTALDLQDLYARKATLKPRTLRLYHAVISAALKSAVRQGLLLRNVASLVEGLPCIERMGGDSLDANCWTRDEARAFLLAAKAAGPRQAAFYAVALDSGVRQGELCGLRWSDLQIDGRTVRIVRQLITPGEQPVFGPPKRGGVRTIDLSEETIALLKVHKKAQAELKLAHRRHYANHNLIFAKEVADLTGKRDVLGLPLQVSNICHREFGRLIAAAHVKRITFHGLRHTSASLLLSAGEAIHVVSQRLGHKNPMVTMSVYAHVLPGQQQQAASRLGALLHGSGSS